VIENEGLIRWALVTDLSARGYRVETACDAATARGRILEDGYDVAVLSIHLPDENGLNLLPLLRDQSRETRVIVLSGDATAENKRRAFDDGAWQFIDKPFDVCEIVQLLETEFGDHPMRRAQRRYRCRAPLRISVIEPPPEEAALDLDNLEATCLDVGPGGMRLETIYQLRVGQKIRSASRQDGPPYATFMPPTAISEVVWTSPGGGGCAAGLRLDGEINPVRAS